MWGLSFAEVHDKAGLPVARALYCLICKAICNFLPADGIHLYNLQFFFFFFNKQSLLQ